MILLSRVKCFSFTLTHSYRPLISLIRTWTIVQQSYLSSTSATTAQRLSLCRAKNATQNIFALSHNETIEEAFLGAKLWWTHEVTPRQAGGGGVLPWRGMGSSDEKRKYTLKIRKVDKVRMLDAYVQHVMDIAKEVRESSRDRLLYTNLGSR